MHGGLLILLSSLVNNVRTKFVEIDIPLASNLQKEHTIYGDDEIDNFRRHHHRHHDNVPGAHHHSLHSIEKHSPLIKSIRNAHKIPDLEVVLPPAVLAAEKKYYNLPPFQSQKRWSRQNEPVPVFHLYGKHEQGDSRRSSLKEAQDGLSSQEKYHPGNSLFYLPGNPLLGAAKFPKRKPDDHSVYGNLQTLGLVTLGKQFKEARAKKRPRARPPDASKQPHLLFDPNHPGMTLVHPKEQLILGYAKFSKPSESSHRVYGNDYSIGLRSRDKLQPLRFQYSGFRRNSDNKQINRSDKPLNYHTKNKTPGLDLPFFFGRRLLRQRNSRKMNSGFSRVRYDNPRDNNYNPQDELSYKSLILRSGESNGDEVPWRLPVMIPIKLPTREQQEKSRNLRLRNEKQRKKNIKPGWVAVLRNNNIKFISSHNKTAKKPLTNQQTIPPWIEIIEKDSKEIEKRKPEISPDKLVYGHFDNLGIRYSNQPYRVKYSDFRKRRHHHGLSHHHLRIHKQPKPSGSNSSSASVNDPRLKYGNLSHSVVSENSSKDNNSDPRPTEPPKFRIHVMGNKRTGPSEIPQFAPIIFNSASPADWRRFISDRVLAALLNPKIKNGKLNSYARKLHTQNQNDIDFVKFTQKAKSYDTKKIVDAVMKAIRDSNYKNQYLYKRRTHPSNAILNRPVNKNGFDIEDSAKEIQSSSEEDDNINYRRRTKLRDRSDNSFERKPVRNCSDSSSTSSTSEEKNPGNPYTIFKNKYKQNWMWNHFMDGDHMNVNPYGPQFDPLGPSGTELFFGRKWWYYNQDDYRPFRRR